MKSVLILLSALLLPLPIFPQDQAGVTKPADDKLLVTPGLPECMKGTVMKGNPAHGAYVIYAKLRRVAKSRVTGTALTVS